MTNTVQKPVLPRGSTDSGHRPREAAGWRCPGGPEPQPARGEPPTLTLWTPARHHYRERRSAPGLFAARRSKRGSGPAASRAGRGSSRCAPAAFGSARDFSVTLQQHFGSARHSSGTLRQRFGGARDSSVSLGTLR